MPVLISTTVSVAPKSVTAGANAELTLATTPDPQHIALESGGGSTTVSTSLSTVPGHADWVRTPNSVGKDPHPVMTGAPSWINGATTWFGFMCSISNCTEMIHQWIEYERSQNFGDGQVRDKRIYLRL